MSRRMTIECDVHFSRQTRCSRRLREGREPQTTTRPQGRVPRVARLMALAIRFEEQVHSGEIASYAELANLGHVTRARISQIVNLVNLAPDIQESILFLPRTERGHDPIHLRLLQPIALTPDWKKQRRLWTALLKARSSATVLAV